MLSGIQTLLIFCSAILGMGLGAQLRGFKFCLYHLTMEPRTTLHLSIPQSSFYSALDPKRWWMVRMWDNGVPDEGTGIDITHCTVRKSRLSQDAKFHLNPLLTPGVFPWPTEGKILRAEGQGGPANIVSSGTMGNYHHIFLWDPLNKGLFCNSSRHRKWLYPHWKEQKFLIFWHSQDDEWVMLWDMYKYVNKSLNSFM